MEVTDEEVRKHWHLVVAASRRVYGKLPPGRRDLDAIESDAALGLFRGLQKFREGGMPLAKYLYAIAANYARKGAARSRFGRFASLEDGEPEAPESLRRWAREKEREEAAEEAPLLLPLLPPREREWAEAHYLGGVQQIELAAEAGLTRQCVSKRLSRSLKMLREGLNERE